MLIPMHFSPSLLIIDYCRIRLYPHIINSWCKEIKSIKLSSPGLLELCQSCIIFNVLAITYDKLQTDKYGTGKPLVTSRDWWIFSSLWWVSLLGTVKCTKLMGFEVSCNWNRENKQRQLFPIMLQYKPFRISAQNAIYKKIPTRVILFFPLDSNSGWEFASFIMTCTFTTIPLCHNLLISSLTSITIQWKNMGCRT